MTFKKIWEKLDVSRETLHTPEQLKSLLKSIYELGHQERTLQQSAEINNHLFKE